MERAHYAPLKLAAIDANRCEVVDAGRTRKVTADSPAIDVMTDLRLVAAATIDPDIGLADANQAMILRGVRTLFVVNSDRAMIGLLGASDLLGEKPVKRSAERGIRPADLTVRDVMVELAAVEAVDIDDVMQAEVGHVVATLKRSGRHHLMVIQRDAPQKIVVRGIFSASQIARQLGIPLHSGPIATTFAEIEAALVA